MWEWSKRVARHAIAAAWTRPAGEPAPTIVDPEVWTGTGPVPPAHEHGGDERSGVPDPVGEQAMFADRMRMLPEYGLAG